MAKYHISENGPAVCTANKRPCPIGGDHFDSNEAAEEAFLKKLENNLGGNSLEGVKKSDPDTTLSTEIQKEFRDFCEAEVDYREFSFIISDAFCERYKQDLVFAQEVDKAIESAGWRATGNPPERFKIRLSNQQGGGRPVTRLKDSF